MSKQKTIEIFEEVLKSWKMAQGCVIDEGGGVIPYSHEELEDDVEEYRRSFLEALGD